MVILRPTLIQFCRNWLKDAGESRDILNIPPQNLDIYVGTYIKTVQPQHTGKGGTGEYEPDSLTSIHRGIDRYLRENEYGFSLVASKEFQTSKKVLETKRGELKAAGKGNKPNAAEPLTPEEEEKLWEKKELGGDNGRVLQNTMWFLTGKLLGFRASDEAKQLEWGDLCLQKDENNVEYIQWNERKTKTRSGNSRTLRPFQPKIFPNDQNKDRCPIELYKKFKEHRPADQLHEHSSFYLSVKQNPTNKIWFKRQPMGQNYLGKIMKDMCNGAGIPGRKTNHSI